MLILNLGAGKKLRKDAVNIDITKYPGINKVVDLSKFPWPWDSCRVDGIYVSHLLEHFPDQEKFLWECHRILKPGGFLRIAAPHSSCITSIGCLGHYRTYSYSTFHDYLSKPFYMFKVQRFRTTEMQLRWWYEEMDAEGNLSTWMKPFVNLIDKLVNLIIRIVGPRVFENLFCGIIQCREVIWEGEKV